MKPVVDGLQASYSDRLDFVVYADANADQDISRFADDQGVQYVPTMMLVSTDGVELNRWVGVVAEGELKMVFGDVAP